MLLFHPKKRIIESFFPAIIRKFCKTQHPASNKQPLEWRKIEIPVETWSLKNPAQDVWRHPLDTRSTDTLAHSTLSLQYIYNFMCFTAI